MSEQHLHVLIVGASSGIASAVARLYAERGARLFLVARDAEKLKLLAGDLKARGAEGVESVAINLAESDKHQQLLDQAVKYLGNIDVALIAHGMLPDQKACEQNFSSLEDCFRLNFLSPVSLLEILARVCERQGAGVLAVISSVAGDRGRQSNYVYGAAKGALTTYLQGLRNRLAPKRVSVVTIKPGFVDTKMTAHLKKGPLFASADAVARGIVKAIDRRSDVVYLPCFWWGIMTIICSIPERIFKRMKL